MCDRVDQHVKIVVADAVYENVDVYMYIDVDDGVGVDVDAGVDEYVDVDCYNCKLC